jgi:predicted translation initiation factor SUI1
VVFQGHSHPAFGDFIREQTVMAKPKKTLLILAADDHKFARMAESAFASAFARLGLPWNVQRRTELTLADRVIVFRGDGETLPIASETDVEPAVNQWIATLLGGGQPAPVIPPPPPPPTKVHTVKLSRETAGRRGKGVTVVSELPLTDDGLQALATKLKSVCGTGGTAKDRRIEIQGDQRDRLTVELEKLGYKVKRAGG